MNKADFLSPSLEDYLEVIYDLTKTNQVARVKDIANKTNVQLSSVTGALKQLTEKGYINYSPYSYITLTKKGIKKAKEIIKVHDILYKIFSEIFLINQEEANFLACKLEHYVNNQNIKNFEFFLKMMEQSDSAKEIKKELKKILNESKYGNNVRSCNKKQ